LGDIPSLREIWQDAAVYVHVDDEEGLAETVNGLMSDAKQLKRYQYKALARAAGFSSSAMAVSYLKIYQQSVQRKRAYKKQHTVL
jgi:glycosyltransferase involved in cell wall biosynthesis